MQNKNEKITGNSGKNEEIRWGHTDTQRNRHQIHFISFLSSFSKQESRLKNGKQGERKQEIFVTKKEEN
jgi:hypothetical protein